MPGAVGAAVAPPIRYRVPAVSMTHMVTDLAPAQRTPAAGVVTFTTAA